jgi:hypothetical protein
MYDSRVSAFLNYTLLMAFESYCNKTETAEEKLEVFDALLSVSNNLFNFGSSTQSTNLRMLKLESNEKVFNSEADKKQVLGFNANIIATWIIQEIWERIPENHKSKFPNEKGIRVLERAFFLVGFDLKQLWGDNKNYIDSNYFNPLFKTLNQLQDKK